MSDQDLSGRLAALETRLARLETVLGGLDGKLDRAATSLTDAKAGIQAWVTDYVSLRLQQLECVTDAAEASGRECAQTHHHCRRWQCRRR